jgi:hypothetical protein
MTLVFNDRDEGFSLFHRNDVCVFASTACRLQDMGGAEKAGNYFLSTIAPPDSDKTATLLSTSEFT